MHHRLPLYVFCHAQQNIYSPLHLPQHVPASLWSSDLFGVLNNAVFNPTAVGNSPGDTASREQLEKHALEAVKALVLSLYFPSLVTYLVEQIGSGR